MRFLGVLAAACWAACLQGWPAFSSEGRLILPGDVADSVSLRLASADDLIGPDDLRVFVGAYEDGKSPMAGRYVSAGQELTFDPAFDFVAGQEYTVRWRDAAKGLDQLTTFRIAPAAAQPEAAVLAIYPSGSELPENTLRFHIQFSAPMQPHRSGDFISLVDGNGVADQAAFMTFKQELWSADRTRLTILMDPGRIKRGVAQNVAMGPALVEGHSYAIVVKDGWPAAAGGSVTAGFEKAFRVSRALRTLPDPDRWHIAAPRRLSGEPLVIDFDRPFDKQRLPSAIQVLDEGGQAIAGRVQIASDERQWRFRPDAPWRVDIATIRIDPRLEDVAGNNFAELLDTAVGTQARPVTQITRRVVLGPEIK